ncbi:helix-turn-helix transcriptional regulator [Solihabitans fulvus]|uniref:Helix-turn-helix transcriptional regulator n=1 Tax=Solihabitans fulvus TaxID=1892852 RepID=A0A5B2WZS5_9PSEU|nr:helix-turn-helix transcriptional regulator [Solihabitans fulvus]KAA2256116.1 helix-turn-helix transcriptional regulator [Solihabitans fulvus]
MTAPERSRLARDRLSRELRRLRTEAKMTGTAAAKAAGMSQSKLSKIENGMLLPSVRDVERLAGALIATEDTAFELVELAKLLHAEVETRRVVLHRGAHRHQQTVGRIEAEATTSRFFQLNMVPALLQSDGYLRVVFAPLPQDEREAAVSALRGRRGVFNDPEKQFVFLLTEGALRWRMGSSEVMRSQLDRLVEVSRRPNVRLGLVPWAANADVVALHGFQVYDERVVTVSVLTGNATITDPADVHEYLELFGRLERLAIYDDDLRGLLTRIAEDYRVLR